MDDALILSVLRDDLWATDCLLQRGADPNYDLSELDVDLEVCDGFRDSDLFGHVCNALAIAISDANVETCKLLIKHHADPVMPIRMAHSHDVSSDGIESRSGEKPPMSTPLAIAMYEYERCPVEARQQIVELSEAAAGDAIKSSTLGNRIFSSGVEKAVGFVGWLVDKFYRQTSLSVERGPAMTRIRMDTM
jgi:hypothetical protein